MSRKRPNELPARGEWPKRRGAASQLVPNQASQGQASAQLQAIEANNVAYMWSIENPTFASVPPFMVSVDVAVKQLCMDLDTGSSVFVIAGTQFRQTFSAILIEAFNVLIESYSGELSRVEGEAHVRVPHGDQEAVLPLFVTKGVPLGYEAYADEDAAAKASISSSCRAASRYCRERPTA